MNRFIVPVVAFLALAAVLYIGVVHSPNKSTMASALLGKPAPAFELPVLGDPSRKFDSRELSGKPWVLNVWATWCAECRVEHEALLRIAARGELPLVGLNWKDEDDAAVDWLKTLGNPYGVVAVDKEGRTAIDFGVYGAPETFLVDGNGTIQWKHVGPLTDDIVANELMPALQAVEGAR